MTINKTAISRWSDLVRVVATAMIAGAITAICLLLCTPQAAHADEITIDGVTYEFYQDTDTNGKPINSVYIASFRSSSKSTVQIPGKINNMPVIALYATSSVGTIKHIDLTKCNQLVSVDLRYYADVESINAANCPKLEELRRPGNSIKTLNVSNCLKLCWIDVSSCGLSTLNVSTCPSLETLWCGGNKLTALDISKNSKLRELRCENNNLTYLDISKNKKLTSLYCEDNRISNLHALEDWLYKGNREGEVYPQYGHDPKGEWSYGAKGWFYNYVYVGGSAKGWLKLGNATYYFDAYGWMKTGWQKISGKWYYFKSSGAMATGWQKVKGKWYYLGPDGVMQTGKKTISDKTYYLTSSGAMKTGWNKESGKWHYYKSSGAMAKGWAKSGGKWYYLNPSDGVMKTGLYDVSGKRYFSNSSGVMQTGWKQLNNKWYYFNKSGAMQKNKWISGKYWVGFDGVMATSTWVDNDRYFVGANGKWMKNKTR